MKIDYEEMKLEYGNSAQEAPIVIIDSGVGGLNIVKHLSLLKPSEHFIFFCDHDFLPFGSKDVRVLSRRVINIIAKVKKLQPKAIVLACNTIDAVVGDKIQGQVGNIPLIRVISNTAKAAINSSKTNQIGLFATPNTIESQKYILDMSGYQSNTHLYGVECPNLATAIERKEDLKNVTKEELSPLLDIDVDTLILGCTHYNAVMPIVKKMYPDKKIIDSTQVLLDTVIKDIENKFEYNVANKGSIKVITTKIDEEFSKNLENYLFEMDYKLLEDEM